MSPAPSLELLPLPEVERVLVSVAHPDDIDFSCAGTVARFRQAGVSVSYAVATRGEQGGFDETPREQIGPLRESEQRAAAAEVGVDDVRFLGFADGHVTVDLELRCALSRVIRDVRPELVLTHEPERNWSAMSANHPDHMAVGEATLRAVYPDARNPFAFPELLREEDLQPWTVRQVWILNAERSAHAVDITEVFDREIAALTRHESQVPAGIDAIMREGNGRLARAAGLTDGHYAEQFRVVDISS